MKYILILCFTLVSISVFSQRTITRDVGSFDELKVYDLLKVNLIPSDRNKITIKGSNIECENYKQEWEIKDTDGNGHTI